MERWLIHYQLPQIILPNQNNHSADSYHNSDQGLNRNFFFIEQKRNPQRSCRNERKNSLRHRCIYITDGSKRKSNSEKRSADGSCHRMFYSLLPVSENR